MAKRCGCLNEGDEIVFGAPHECSLPARTAVPGEPLPEVPTCSYAPGAVPLSEGLYAMHLGAELDRLEPLYRHILDNDDLDPGEG